MTNDYDNRPRCHCGGPVAKLGDYCTPECGDAHDVYLAALAEEVQRPDHARGRDLANQTFEDFIREIVPEIRIEAYDGTNVTITLDDWEDGRQTLPLTKLLRDLVQMRILADDDTGLGI